jgi:3-hydroxybutyryl-CoA dehydrogenase
VEVNSLQRVGVLGIGTMGAGIAQVCAQSGMSVTIVDVSEELLRSGRDRIGDFLQEGVRRGKLDAADREETLGRLRGTSEISDLDDVGLVIEAIVEDLESKRDLLGAVAQVISKDAVIATNTSALSVTAIATAVPAPERVAGLHFFNPAPLMPLVEVVEAVQTSHATLEFLEAVALRLGKDPVVTKDRPGFVVNRLLMPYLNQVVRDLDDGVAKADDLDAALELGLGYPVGPLKLLDLIGLDNHLHATQGAWDQTRDPGFVPPPLLERLVTAGHLGRKSGSGFYRYGDR